MAIGQELRFDFPDNMCFGCSPHNDRGLQLTFTQVSHSGVAGRYTAPAHTCGAPGVVHGGVQAALLDEAVGFAVHAHHESVGALEDDEAAWRKVVTVEFDLRYRRPVPTDVEFGLRAEVVRVSGRDYLAVAEILGDDDEVLTSATAKWRRIH
ncbi:MAG TPA: PaaI family thioesterase [Acidimicrobiales bacterium]|nr:PaaI family thioesterase [Acidimicrobiales bacterium]